MDKTSTPDLPGSGDAGHAPVIALPMAIAENEITRWAVWLKVADRSKETIRLRTYHVRRVMLELHADPWSVTTEQLVDFLGDRDWGPETRRSCRASLVVFYDWAQATGRRADNPARLLPTIKLPRRVPRPTPDDVYRAALLRSDERVRLMIHLAAVCGLRRGEIARSHRDHVAEDREGWSLHVTGKGGHERWVPLPVELARKLRTAPAGWIFPSSSKRSRSGHLEAERVGELVSESMPVGWTCHTLRHRCATVAYATDRDLRAVQELLGHAKPETTALYTKVPADAIRRAVNAAAA